jgi:hypothetical protein
LGFLLWSTKCLARRCTSVSWKFRKVTLYQYAEGFRFFGRAKKEEAKIARWCMVLITNLVSVGRQICAPTKLSQFSYSLQENKQYQESIFRNEKVLFMRGKWFETFQSGGNDSKLCIHHAACESVEEPTSSNLKRENIIFTSFLSASDQKFMK